MLEKCTNLTLLFCIKRLFDDENFYFIFKCLPLSVDTDEV